MKNIFRRVVSTTYRSEEINDKVKMDLTGFPDDSSICMLKCRCGKEFGYAELPIHEENLADAHNPELMAQCPNCTRRFFFIRIINVFEYKEETTVTEYDEDGHYRIDGVEQNEDD